MSGWFYCLKHDRPESGSTPCASEDRLGPYASREEALAWRDRVERRNERWEDDDERWHGREDD